MASSTRPQSSAVRHMGPSLSSVQQRAIAPWRETRPYVGRSPERPLNDAGVRMEPEVSEPIEKPTSPAAVAAPEPLEEPPLQYAVFQGVRPGPVKLASGLLYPMPPASSTMASLATSTAPASRSRTTAVASWSKTWLR